MTVGQSREAFASGPHSMIDPPPSQGAKAPASVATWRNPPPPKKNPDTGVEKRLAASQSRVGGSIQPGNAGGIVVSPNAAQHTLASRRVGRDNFNE
jgi:hypothetical protein